MMKLSRFGAAALAIALSVTFVNPTVALAKTERTAQLNYAGSFRDDSEIFDEDTIDLGEIKGGSFADYGDARSDCEKKFAEILLAKGLITATKPASTVGYRTIYLDGKDYYYGRSYDYDGYEDSLRYEGPYSETDDNDASKEYCYYEAVRGTIYKNRITGKTSIFKDELFSNYTTDEATARQFQKAIRIKKGDTTYLGVYLQGGDTTISGIKSSKKAVATAKLYTKLSEENITNEDLASIDEIYDSAAGKWTYTVYYYTTVGAKVVVGTYDNEDDAKAAQKNVSGDSSSARRYIALNAKKKGKTNLTFNIVNRNGATTKVTTTVYVVDDTSALKSFSYGGLSLLEDYSNSKNINYGKKGDDYRDTTTKKSGKLVVKANPNYQIKKIEVGALYDEAWSEGISGTNRDGDKYDRSAEYSQYSSSGVTTNHRVDLNNDGDFDDTIDGIYEGGVTYKYTTVKSGKRIKLSKVWSKYGSTSSSSTSKVDKNSKGEFITETSQNKDRGFRAPTRIRITFYDKLSKTYGQIEKTIYLVVKK